MAAGAYWIKPPSQLAAALREYQEKLKAAIRAAAAYTGQKMQDEARQRARWSDRTGNARSGLFYAVDGFGFPPIVGQTAVTFDQPVRDVITESGGDGYLILCLGHTMWYGKFLELSNGGRYAIVLSTFNANLPILEGVLKGVLR